MLSEHFAKQSVTFDESLFEEAGSPCGRPTGRAHEGSCASEGEMSEDSFRTESSDTASSHDSSSDYSSVDAIPGKDWSLM